MTTKGYDVKTKIGGLYNNFNEYAAPPGLAIADNVYVARKNIIGRRPGFDSCSTNLPTAKPQQLMVDNDYLYCHINNQLYSQQGDCAWTRLSGFTPTITNPMSIASDSSYLYFVDEILGVSGFRIRRIRFADGLTQTIGSLAGSLPFIIYGMFWDAGNLYLLRNFALQQFNVSTAVTTTLAGVVGTDGAVDGIGAAARFQNCQGIVGPLAGFFYIADTGNSAIRAYEIATGNVTTIAGALTIPGDVDNAVGTNARLLEPNGLCTDGTALYYKCDQKLKKTMLGGTNATTTVATGITSSSLVDTYTGLSTDGTYVYFPGRTSQVVKRIRISDGAIATLAGQLNVAGSANGLGTNAQFNGPMFSYRIGSLLYIGEQLNRTIRTLNTATGEAGLFAGRIGAAGLDDGYPLTSFSAPPP